jgi:integrase
VAEPQPNPTSAGFTVRYRRPAWHHDPRHTCATALPSKGVNRKPVQELPGHADTKVILGTCSRYLRRRLMVIRIHE